ncbi:MAG: hypothetical protein QF903_08495 [Planctomycetota bacterium]|jgi:hypothetical protein|nr:hypothetical protein [Planctomycetota bacterium]MDP6989505.1 hypothetical protein [Planctomycetota bacterium]
MIHPSRRGAARVPIIWMVAVMVAFFVALALVFISNDEAAKAQESAAAMKTERDAANLTAQQSRQTIREISEVLGHYDETTASAESDVTAATAGLDQVKAAFPDMGPAVANFEQATARIIPAWNAKVREVADLNQQVGQLQADIAAKNQTLTELAQTKDAQLADLRSQLTDAEQAAAARQSDLESEVASVRNTLGDTERQLARLTGEKEDVQRGWDDREVEMSTRFREMGSKLAFLREPEKADGEILAVSKDLGLGWINLGERNRLFEGMSFRVVDGTPGDHRVKAWCQVLSVQEDMAEVAFSAQADRFNPPTPGDVIFNPLYDPAGDRNAVLVGRFSGTYNEKELRTLLDGIQVNVQGVLDKTTDYLIVGSELYHDEDGEILEDPLQPSELSVYKEAEAMGVQIVPLKLVREYFRRG